MFDLKISGIAGGTAFLLSLLLGYFSGAAFTAVFLRALIFGVVFFVLASGAYFLITRFLPELLDEAGGGRAGRPGRHGPGSLVNITLDDPELPSGEISRPPIMPGETGEGFPAGDGLDDISSLGVEPLSPQPEEGSPGPEKETGGPVQEASMGLDQSGQNEYTEKGIEEDPFGEDLLPPPVQPEFAAGPGRTAASSREPPVSEAPAGSDSLPDLDTMAGAFFSPEDEGRGEPADFPAARKPSSGGGSSKLGGDFDPKELANAIRDRLKRE